MIYGEVLATILYKVQVANGSINLLMKVIYLEYLSRIQRHKSRRSEITQNEQMIAREEQLSGFAMETTVP